MPKYQIILESDKILVEAELENYIKSFWENSCQECGFNQQFKFMFATNLEEIKKELWRYTISNMQYEKIIKILNMD